MKNSIKLLAALSIIGFSGTAFAQNSTTAAATASATIIQPISISVGPTALEFGNIVATANGGSVTESANNTDYSLDAGSDPGAGNYGTGGHDASFTITGANSANVSYSAGPITGLPGTVSLSIPGATGSGNLGVGGSLTVTYGGTLTIGAGVGAGALSASWTETAMYN